MPRLTGTTGGSSPTLGSRAPSLSLTIRVNLFSVLSISRHRLIVSDFQLSNGPSPRPSTAQLVLSSTLRSPHYCRFEHVLRCINRHPVLSTQVDFRFPGFQCDSGVGRATVPQRRSRVGLLCLCVLELATRRIC